MGRSKGSSMKRMLTAGQIQDLCKLIKGFGIREYGREVCLVTPLGHNFVLNKTRISALGVDKRFYKEVYPMFLQKAIEGINKRSYLENKPFEITQHRWGLEVFDHRQPKPKNSLGYFRFESDGTGSYETEVAKEQAIKLVLESI